MNNNWDRFSILTASFIGGLLIILILSISGYIPYAKIFSHLNNKNFKLAKAVIYSIENKIMDIQSKTGNENFIIDYKVHYNFKVNNKYFEKVECIDIYQNPKFRLYIQQHLNQEAFYVRYEIANPKNCLLVEDVK